MKKGRLADFGFEEISVDGVEWIVPTRQSNYVEWQRNMKVLVNW